MSKIRCPKCLGLLVWAEEGTGVVERCEVIRCVNCGYRVERSARPRRSVAPPVEPDPLERIEIMPKGKSVKKVCTTCGNERKIIGRGLCGTCYWRARRAEGTVEKPAGTEAATPVPAKPPAGMLARVQAAPLPVALPGMLPRAYPHFEVDLDEVLTEVRALLIAKNNAYGDSALSPVRVFSRADPVEQIRVRLDDKLSRLMRGQDAGEDTRLDFLGYLVLERIALRRRDHAAG